MKCHAFCYLIKTCVNTSKYFAKALNIVTEPLRFLIFVKVKYLLLGVELFGC